MCVRSFLWHIVRLFLKQCGKCPLIVNISRTSCTALILPGNKSEYMCEQTLLSKIIKVTIRSRKWICVLWCRRIHAKYVFDFFKLHIHPRGINWHAPNNGICIYNHIELHYSGKVQRLDVPLISVISRSLGRFWAILFQKLSTSSCGLNGRVCE